MATTSAETHTGTEVPADAHSTGTFPPFDGGTFASQILWLAITFGLLYWIMSKVALPRISGILEDRRDRIAGDLAEANRLKQESDAAIAAYEQALAEARGNAHKIAHDTRAKLKSDVEARRTAAEAGLADKLSDAEKHIAELKTTALANVGEIATDTTTALVETLIGKAPTKAELTKAVDSAMK
ncbi:F0F1 ATP synthase subunit B [Stappia taiwanensis]|uniref:ATP synthase subunit b n=1 Tax=Stappia taiwanensis TaxID=992267 RepID=A0A838XTX0_9HYPH|nr:F0F1 ATP synthase subunit B [Stappia taiwanensis]MBA4611976.1 F0F1 ATP synthase subunit B [Stappia taiwanensis]GGE92101.1 ATP synthase subunit b 2 [Stappia taiwanensis]